MSEKTVHFRNFATKFTSDDLKPNVTICFSSCLLVFWRGAGGDGMKADLTQTPNLMPKSNPYQLSRNEEGGV